MSECDYASDWDPYRGARAQALAADFDHRPEPDEKSDDPLFPIYCLVCGSRLTDDGTLHHYTTPPYS